jgi:serine/threonine protein kinase
MDVGPLERAISNNTIPAKLRLGICFDVASGLNALHGCGIFHCDIKPGNVLLFTDKKRELVAKLADFGLSLADSGEGIELSGGTKGWNAPEWKSYIPADRIAKADVYSFGLLVWSVMTMTRDPFQGIGIPIPTHFQEIEASKASDGLMLRKVISHLTRNSTACPSPAVSSAVAVVQETIRKDPSQRDLTRAIDLLKQGMPERDPRARYVQICTPDLWLSTKTF